MEELHLLTDLALILISAGVMTLLFKWLKQPLVLGYIVAGFLVGPHFNLFPTIMETSSISEWSEIGIIFLLFALGLEFSFKRLFKVGSTAFITAGVEIITVFVAGYLTGYLFGWSTVESIFLGGMLAMSSTTIVVKAFNDMGIQKQKFADIVLVVLIIQDFGCHSNDGAAACCSPQTERGRHPNVDEYRQTGLFHHSMVSGGYLFLSHLLQENQENAQKKQQAARRAGNCHKRIHRTDARRDP